MFKLNHIYQGCHALDLLKTFPDNCIDMCVTSPPYYSLRSYGTKPMVWDGDVNCQHEWIENAIESKTNTKQDNSGGLSNKVISRGEQENSRAVVFTVHSASCSKCGAWKGELGQEPTPELYINHLAQIFHEVRRVLKSEGTLWLNLGDCYAGSGKGIGSAPDPKWEGARNDAMKSKTNWASTGFKSKDLIGIPWRAAFAFQGQKVMAASEVADLCKAIDLVNNFENTDDQLLGLNLLSKWRNANRFWEILQRDNWFLRSDIIWHKNNAMPSSVKDRPTTAHEYVFLLSKSKKYYYDADAIAEPSVTNDRVYTNTGSSNDKKTDEMGRLYKGFNERYKKKHLNPEYGGGGLGLAKLHDTQKHGWEGQTRNKRDVWTINTRPFKGAHFATYPPSLVRPCILAGCPINGIVLDPFMGSGTTAQVCIELDRNFVGIELNPEYKKFQDKRIHDTCERLLAEMC